MATSTSAEPIPGAPTVSLNTIAATYDSEDNLVTPAIVQTLEDNTSLLTLVFSVEGEVPEDGLVVTVNSDIAFTDNFAGLGLEPFSPGGEAVGAIVDEETGETTGLQFRINQPNAVLNLPIKDDSITDEPYDATFSLESGENYNVSADAGASTVTFYDTLEQVPAADVEPEVSLSFDNTTLDESAGDSTTLTFSLSEPPPEDGLLVYVQGQTNEEGDSVGGDLADFSILDAEVDGGVFPAPNFGANGFYFKILEQTATITTSAFADEEIEGIEELNLSLQEAPGYTIAEDAGTGTLTIQDAPDSQIQVGLVGGEPEVLVETEGTAAILNFNLSAPPPEEGLAITVSSDSFSDFTGSTGGEISSSTFNITEQNASITLPVINDGVDEGVEDITFTLEAGDGYQIADEANSATFTIADTPELLPPSTEEPNDTIETAIATGLSADNSSVSFDGEINQYFTEDDELAVDATEDVDFYSFTLQAGETVALNVDTPEDSLLNYSQLRVFNNDGEELAVTDFDDFQAAPGEVFSSFNDPYLEYTASEEGTYYVGISQLDNLSYDPSTQGSGSGAYYPDFDIAPGEYTMDISLV